MGQSYNMLVHAVNLKVGQNNVVLYERVREREIEELERERERERESEREREKERERGRVRMLRFYFELHYQSNKLKQNEWSYIMFIGILVTL